MSTANPFSPRPSRTVHSCGDLCFDIGTHVGNRSIEVALDCVPRLSALGRYRYNVSMVETMRFQWPDWRGEDQVLGFLKSLPRTGRSCDVYAKKVADR